MYYAYRLTDSPTQHAYPLAIDGQAQWQPVPDAKLSLWRTAITLPAVPEKHIVVPSFSMQGGNYQYQVALTDTNTDLSSRLNPLLTSTEQLAQWPEKYSDLSTVSDEIDCWHSKVELTNTEFEITVESEYQPQHYLLVLSIRALELECPFSAMKSISLDQPAAFSQMTAEAKLRNRICSPTSLAMVHTTLTGQTAFSEIVEQCYDPASKAYGKLPLAIKAANTLNLAGAVESLPSWASVSDILNKGWIVVCSIRFDKNSLTGAPLKQSGGHLVVLYGIDLTDSEEPSVLVMDPAGKTQSEVPRRYKLAEFSKAWLGYRGGGYILNLQQPVY